MKFLLLLTAEFAFDLCSGLRWEISTFPLLWPYIDIFQLKIILGSNAVVFCACEIIHFLNGVFYVVRFVHKFGFRLLTENRTACSERRSCFWHGVCLALTVTAILRTPGTLWRSTACSWVSDSTMVMLIINIAGLLISTPTNAHT